MGDAGSIVVFPVRFAVARFGVHSLVNVGIMEHFGDQEIFFPASLCDYGGEHLPIEKRARAGERIRGTYIKPDECTGPLQCGRHL